MIGFRSTRRMITTLTLLATVVVLPRCMLVPHHGSAGNVRPEQATGSHAKYEKESAEPTTAEVAVGNKTLPRHEESPMFHGGRWWGWFMGGAMVVMMGLVLL